MYHTLLPDKAYNLQSNKVLSCIISFWSRFATCTKFKQSINIAIYYFRNWTLDVPRTLEFLLNRTRFNSARRTPAVDSGCGSFDYRIYVTLSNSGIINKSDMTFKNCALYFFIVCTYLYCRSSRYVKYKPNWARKRGLEEVNISIHIEKGGIL